MSDTNIEWTHPAGFRGASWNPVAGCRRISPGCGGAKGVGGCYAEKIAMRFSQAPGKSGDRFRLVVRTDASGKPTGWNGRFVEIPEKLDEPLRTRRPTCWFVNSMSDLFGEGVADEYIAAAFGVMAATPQHTYQILTKRAERLPRWYEWHRRQCVSRFDFSGNEWRICEDEAREHIPDMPATATGAPWPLPNVWIGCSVEDQQRADERIPHLLRVPAAVRFLSVEPMLEAISLARWTTKRSDSITMCRECCWKDRCDEPRHFFRRDCPVCKGTGILPDLGWVIVGGESGPGARPFNVDWARSILGQCRAAGVPAFCKQLGAHVAWDGVQGGFGDGPDNRWPDGTQREDTGRGYWRVLLRNRKGGDPEEWPEDLRVREWPEARRA